MAGVGGHAAQDRHERALAHVVAVVDRLAAADAGEQLVVLGLVDVRLGAGVAPIVGGLDRQSPFALAKLGTAFGPHDVGADVVLAALLLPAIGEQLRAVGILVDHGEVVIDVPVLRPGAHLPAAQAHGPNGVFILRHPGADVEEVDVLFDVEIARQPGEVVPVPHLPGHIAPLRQPRLDPDRAAIVVG